MSMANSDTCIPDGGASNGDGICSSLVEEKKDHGQTRGRKKGGYAEQIASWVAE